MEFGPPAIVVIAEIKHIGGARLDGHDLRGSDVVDRGDAERRIYRVLGGGIVDDMNLGAADPRRVARPAGAVLVQPQAGGINSIRRAVEVAAQTAAGLRHQRGKQRLEHRARAVCVGVGEC